MQKIFALDQPVMVKGVGEGTIDHYVGQEVWHVHMGDSKYLDVISGYITPLTELSEIEVLKEKIGILQSYCEMVAEIINPAKQPGAGTIQLAYGMLLDVRELTDDEK